MFTNYGLAFLSTYVSGSQSFFRCDAFGKVCWTYDPIRVPGISNRVPTIRENYHRVPKIRENRVPTDPYRVPNIFLKKKPDVIDENTTLVFCFICTFVQIKVKHWELIDTLVISSFHNNSFLMNTAILSDTSSIFLSGPCIEIMILFNLAKISHK